MAGGGVRARNVERTVAITGVSEVHSSAARSAHPRDPPHHMQPCAGADLFRCQQLSAWGAVHAGLEGFKSTGMPYQGNHLAHVDVYQSSQKACKASSGALDSRSHACMRTGWRPAKCCTRAGSWPCVQGSLRRTGHGQLLTRMQPLRCAPHAGASKMRTI